MQRWKNIGFNVLLCLNCFLLVFVIAGDKLKVPSWLQVAGRMHPLVLHFPIVLLLVYIIWKWTSYKKASLNNDAADWFLLATAITAAITADMGWLLSREPGYNADAIALHQWGGVVLTLLLFAWYGFRNTKFFNAGWGTATAAGLSFALMLVTGHQGSTITHGENFLLAPVTPEKVKVPVALDQAQIFTDMVMPIFEEKCMSCHNSKKAKGQLIMETAALLQKGGKHGVLWTSGQPEISLLLERIHLPEDNKKHMPPVGKPQLDEEEVAILYQWIKAGAPFDKKVIDIPETDSLRILAAGRFGSGQEEHYAFAAASESDIEKLTNTNRLIQPIAMESPALTVNFYNQQNFSTAALKELLPLKTQIVSLDLAYMPLKEEDMAVVGEFLNLRNLNLNFSTVPGASLAQLKKLAFLKHLSLSGTGVASKDLAVLTALPQLQSVYLWNAPGADKDIAALQKANPAVRFETGFMNDSMMLKLNPPILETEQRIVNGGPIYLRLKHYIKGVTIRYTMDGSTPDSVHSLVYKDSVPMDHKGIFKARAFKKGWIGSDSVAASFFQNSFRADSIRNLTPLDSFYKGSHFAKTLIDGDKGDFNFRNGKWLGFRRNRMEMLMRYPEPVTVSSVTLSTVVDMGSYIMPPVSVEVWGGSDEKKLTRLSVLHNPMPDSMRAPYMWGYECNFKPVTVKYLKVVAVPVSKMPAWHPGKGQPGWVFTDEIFVN
ncbi:MAG: chitobiase/beta-hexosaminidase C-terminal domain-containing protein [Bacteroidota bacterium]|nr:chitobiase/beta-hexosaminidase C-terminal domain-containing protein [Bacteroidota bacterium]